MKLSVYLSILAIVSIGAMQSASAQERPQVSEKMNRFNFAPNTWKSEEGNVPAMSEPAHQVQSGSMPSKNMLGLDPSMLSKPAPAPVAPPPMPVVRANVIAPPVQHPADFNPAFGKPMVAQTPSIIPQQAKAQPMVPTNPQTAQAKPSTATAPMKIAAKPHVTTGVTGRLSKPRQVAPATASPVVASYAPGVGYTPGTLLPHSVHQASNANMSVSGQILRSR